MQASVVLAVLIAWLGVMSSANELVSETFVPILQFAAAISVMSALPVLAHLFEIRSLNLAGRPVFRILEACPTMEPRAHETAFRDGVLRAIAREVTTQIRPELPLVTGTRVDGWFEHNKQQWYVTIKKRLNNQQRLTLQGEVEDILLHAPKSGKVLWVVILVCVDDLNNPATVAQLNALRQYARARSSVGNEKASRRAAIVVGAGVIGEQQSSLQVADAG